MQRMKKMRKSAYYNIKNRKLKPYKERENKESLEKMKVKNNQQAINIDLENKIMIKIM